MFVAANLSPSYPLAIGGRRSDAAVAADYYADA
jgi:hypothetical protein